MPTMRAAILAVGSELLGTDRLDTNSLLLTERLRRYGVELERKAVVGDDLERIAGEIEGALASTELVLVTGGLGPTADDLTREAAARALGRRLERRPELVEEIRAKFASFGMRMPEVNLKQAEVLEGARVLANPRGTAPGLQVEEGSRTLFLFPGVPRELEGLIEQVLDPWLHRRCGGVAVETRVLKIACLPESTLEERIQPYYREFGSEGLSVLSQPGEIQLRLTRRGEPGERAGYLEARVEGLTGLLGDSIYGWSQDDSLESVVGERLRRSGCSVCTAESCTGGLVAERLTRVPGSSDYFVGGVVAYADRIKAELLGVPAGLLERHGAVSEEVARAMAEGGRRLFGVDHCVAISGIAGPGGGSAEKPVGTVHVAVGGPQGCKHRLLRLPGDRKRVRRLAAQWGLDLLRRTLPHQDRAARSV